MIKVENLVKSFGDVRAVDGLSFEVEKGEVVGLLGPNGAGKTTTMRLMAGFFAPDEGSVSMFGDSVIEEPIKVQQYIGYMPENNPLYKDMLVSELLNFSADLRRIPRAEKKQAIKFAVTAVDIGEVFYRPVGELSKGFKQRTGLALALLQRPRVLIMDEPTEGLDPNQRTEIRALIKELAKERTIIMSTHVMQEASAVCNRLLIINKGKLAADGTADELAKAARKERILQIEVEGQGIEQALNNMPELAKVDNIEKIKENRFKANLIIQGAVELQPEISKLAVKNNWIIWQISEKEHKLEDVFHKLTNPNFG